MVGYVLLLFLLRCMLLSWPIYTATEIVPSYLLKLIMPSYLLKLLLTILQMSTTDIVN